MKRVWVFLRTNSVMSVSTVVVFAVLVAATFGSAAQAAGVPSRFAGKCE
jgi:hypothetical protein